MELVERRASGATRAMGCVDWWLRLARLAPGVANLFMALPGISALAAVACGLPPDRRLPPLAAEPFHRWFSRREPRNPTGLPVLLWPGTFNDQFNPGTAKAAVEVLEAAGCRVVVPRGAVSCGWPFDGLGSLDSTKGRLRRTLDLLRPQLAAGMPLVGLEPSCIALFRNELAALFPNDEGAQRLSRQSFQFGEQLVERLDWHPPRLDREVVVHGHRHPKSLLGMEADEELLRRLGVEGRALEAGHAGGAGAFGSEAFGSEAGEGSQLLGVAGERSLSSAVRRVPKDALVVANGFSCRAEIERGSDRHALHIAQVALMALRESELPGSPYPERPYLDRPATVSPVGLLVAGAALLGASWLWGRSRRRRAVEAAVSGSASWLIPVTLAG